MKRALESAATSDIAVADSIRVFSRERAPVVADSNPRLLYLMLRFDAAARYGCAATQNPIWLWPLSQYFPIPVRTNRGARIRENCCVHNPMAVEHSRA
jgi:hypothetical protein